MGTILLWLENVVLVKSPGRVAQRHCGFGNDSRKLAVIWLLKKQNKNDSNPKRIGVVLNRRRYANNTHATHSYATFLTLNT